MPEPIASKLPELVIFGGTLPAWQFSAVSAAIFHANMITGNILPSVHGQLCCATGWKNCNLMKAIQKFAQIFISLPP